jgi:phosphohistidine phosphatase
MKTVVIVRHAKSSWDDLSISDFDRPLNERGKKDAPKMAERLLKKKIEIDAIISSPAKRAKKTAQAFAEVFHVKREHAVYPPELYLASPDIFFEVIAKADDAWNHIALFSHNPGITDFVNQLKLVKVDDMPTCAVFAMESDARHWKDFRQSEKKFLLFDYPKQEEKD